MNILVIRLHRLGDILQLCPLFRGLKSIYPFSNLYLLTGEGYESLFIENPDIDHIIPLPEKRYRYWMKNAKDSRVFNELYDLIDDYKKVDFDLIINRQYETGAMLAYLIGGKQVVGGSYHPDQGFFFSDSVSDSLCKVIKTDRKMNRTNLVDWSLRIAGVHHSIPSDRYLAPSRQSLIEAESLLGGTIKTGSPKPVAVQIGASRAFRQWGIENFALLISWLTKVKGKPVILIGSPEEMNNSNALLEKISDRNHICNLVGKTNLGTLAAVLDQCETLITGDTGPMHMAAMLGTSVLALFYGTAFPWETAPYGKGHFVVFPDVACAPCADPARCREDHFCKKQITPAIVQEAFQVMEAKKEHLPSSGDRSSASLPIYVTAFDQNGEQTLFPFDRESESCGYHATKVSLREPVSLSLIDVNLLEKNREAVIKNLLSGDLSKGFQMFSEYIGLYSQFLRQNPEIYSLAEGGFAGIIESCSRGLHAGDPVAIIDALRYKFPLSTEFEKCEGTDRGS